MEAFGGRQSYELKAKINLGRSITYEWGKGGIAPGLAVTWGSVWESGHGRAMQEDLGVCKGSGL